MGLNVSNISNSNVYTDYKSRNAGLTTPAYGNSYPKSAKKSRNGKFDSSEAIRNFAYGLVSPITGLFSSAKNFIMGIGTIAATTALIAATGGAAAPILIAAGVGLGAFQAGKGIYQLVTAKNGDEAEKAFYDIGGATSAVALSIAGAKSSLKAANVETEELTLLNATKKCFTSIKDLTKESFNVFKSGHFKSNLANFMEFFKTPSSYKKAARNSYEEGKESFDISFNALKEVLPEKYKGQLKGRNKSEISRYSRIVRERTSEIDKKIADINNNTSYSSELKKQKIQEILTKQIPDEFGARLTLEDTNPGSVEELVSALIKAVEKGDIKIIEIENYRGINSEYPGANIPYFNKNQIDRLSKVAEEDLQVLRNADKKSGYTAVQLKIQPKNSKVMELQIRGQEVDKVADWEHIPYDLRQGKDISKGNNQVGIILNDVQKAIKTMSKEDYTKYQKYIYENFIHAQAKELGKQIPEPQLPEGINPILSAKNLEKLSLQMAQYKSGCVQDPRNVSPQIAVAAGVESIMDED